jgi:hypothetical protein
MPAVPSLHRAALMGAMSASGLVQADSVPVPHLVAIDTIGSASPDFGLPPDPLRVPVTALRLRFDLPMLPVAADFLLVHAGADRRFDTLDCAAQGGDDVAMPVASLAGSADAREVVLNLTTPHGLAAGVWRVLACDSLRSLAGVVLDGDGDGSAGGHALRALLVAEDPQLDNPNFSAGLDGWIVRGTGNYTVEVVTDDADGSAHSRALRIAGRNGATVLLGSSTCVQVPALNEMVSYRSRFRYRVLQGRVVVTTDVATGFSGDQGEPECLGPSISARDQLVWPAATPGFALHDAGTRMLPAFPHAGLTLFLASPDDAFEILIDDVGLTFDPNVVFRSRFEPDLY